MISQSLSLVGIAFAVSFVLLSLLWALQLRTRNAALVDVGWALSLFLAAGLYLLAAPGDLGWRLLAFALGGGWALRLALHLYFERIHQQQEEGRYAYLRQYWGERADRNFFFFFVGQAFLAALFSIPFLLVASISDRTFGVLELGGVLLWLAAVWGESRADAQLAAFRRAPEHKGKTCREGFWRYSRHPNYFFEWLHWWSYVLLAWQGPYGEASLLFPFLMLFFLLKLSGIPYTELQAIRSRGEDYRRYQREVNAFFPWFPRSSTGG